MYEITKYYTTFTTLVVLYIFYIKVV